MISDSTGPQDTSTHLFQKVAGDGLFTKKSKLLIRQLQDRDAGFPVRFLAICKFYGSENSYIKSAKQTQE